MPAISTGFFRQLGCVLKGHQLPEEVPEGVSFLKSKCKRCREYFFWGDDVSGLYKKSEGWVSMKGDGFRPPPVVPVLTPQEVQKIKESWFKLLFRRESK